MEPPRSTSSGSAPQEPAKDRRVPELRRRVTALLERSIHEVALDADTDAAPPGLLVACSGGPDSTALLNILAELVRSQRVRVRLVVAHYRHRLQARDAAMAAYVAQLAHQYGAACCVGDWEAEAGAHRTKAGEGLEDAARRARYRFLSRAAAEHDCTMLATGHTLDDQAETVLMRLLAGTGLDGLQGIAPLRPHRQAPQPLWVVRPLLGTRRDEVEAYLAACGLEPIEDPTNRDPGLMRNRIRHEVLPQLASINPGVTEHLAGLAEDARENHAWTQAAVQAGLAATYDDAAQRLELTALHAQLGASLTRQALKQLFVDRLGLPARRITRQLLENVAALREQKGGTELVLPHGWRARAVQSAAERISLHLYRPPRPPAGASLLSSRTDLPLTLSHPGELLFRSGRFRWRLCVETLVSVDAAALAEHRREERAEEVWLAAAAVVWPVTVRVKQPGERFRPLGAPGRRPLKELFREAGVASPERATWPLLVDATGKVLWLVRLALAESARLHEARLPATALRATVEAHELEPEGGVDEREQVDQPRS